MLMDGCDIVCDGKGCRCHGLRGLVLVGIKGIFVTFMMAVHSVLCRKWQMGVGLFYAKGEQHEQQPADTCTLSAHFYSDVCSSSLPIISILLRENCQMSVKTQKCQHHTVNNCCCAKSRTSTSAVFRFFFMNSNRSALEPLVKQKWCKVRGLCLHSTSVVILPVWSFIQSPAVESHGILSWLK